MNETDERNERRFHLLGVEVNALSLQDLNDLIGQVVDENRQAVVANHNLHSIYLYHHVSVMRRFFHRAEYVHVDGMLVILLARILGLPLTRRHRVTYVDWIRPLATRAAREGWRIFYLGGRPGVAARGADILRGEIPGLDLRTHHGYLQHPEAEAAALAAIAEHKPHVLMVGMGMPLQERWILEHREQLDAHVFLPSGACMDYVAGEVSTPPRWMGRIGLEWLYRLVKDPRRLARRYLWEPWFILRLLAVDLVRRRPGSERAHDGYDERQDE